MCFHVCLLLQRTYYCATQDCTSCCKKITWVYFYSYERLFLLSYARMMHNSFCSCEVLLILLLHAKIPHDYCCCYKILLLLHLKMRIFYIVVHARTLQDSYFLVKHHCHCCHVWKHQNLKLALCLQSCIEQVGLWNYQVIW